MDSFEWNKVFAAILVAGIAASLSSFIADKMVHPEHVAAQGVEEAAAGAGGGTAKTELPEPILALIADADIERGKKLSKACAACHSFEKGGPSGVGPNLWNIMNRGICMEDGFAYSDVFLARKNDPWNYGDLSEFLRKPKKYMAGTKMNYIGLKKPADRAAMIAWLRTLSDSPVPLPTAEAIAAEEAAFTAETAIDDSPTEANPVEEVIKLQDEVQTIVEEAVEAAQEHIPSVVR